MSVISLGVAMIATLSYFFRLEADNLHSADLQKFKEREDEAEIPEYDFVIVGGGTAGCLVAYKLSKHFSVLLLEAGGPAPSLTTVPAFRDFSAQIKGINFFYKTTKQPHAANRRISLTAGYMLGGSFAHNELIYYRGNSRGYDLWANLTNDPSWKYENVVPIYKKLESYYGPFPSAYRGTSGPVPLRTGNPPGLHFYIQAAKELGYNYGDTNGPQQEGFGPIDFFQDGARAVTTCTIFIQPIMNTRSTLMVQTYSTVTKIQMSGKTATGVEFTRHGVPFSVTAKKEVILSAGTYGSALLLFKSGIGPAKMLRKADIPVVAPLLVGKTLYNHPSIVFNITAAHTMDILTVSQNLTEEKFQAYLRGENDGVLSEEGSGPGAFFVSKVAKSAGELHWPDIEFTRGVARVDDTGRAYVPIKIVITRPKSLGSLKLNTKRYRNGEIRDTKLAIINFNLLQHKEDVNRMLEGIHKVLAIYKTQTFKSHGIQVVPYKFCSDNHEMGSNSYWTCVIRQAAGTTRHVAGTCKMGFGKRDKNAVVDNKFRVIGFKRLRIVDASIIPHLPNANINAAVILLAETGSKQILLDHHVI